MNEHYLYLALNLGSFLLPALFSFYPKAPFYKEWKFLFPALLATAIIFIAWDEWFTQRGVWGFNPRYLTGIYWGSLPMEEIMFFFFIPYACVFIYFASNHLSRKDYLAPHQRIITGLLILLLLLLGVLNFSHAYTSVTFLSLAGFLGLHNWWRSSFLGRFYFAYLFILFPFMLVNGILTGSFIEDEVVWYNNLENLNVRLGTIPVDDFFYNMLMLLLVVSLYEWGKRNYAIVP